MIRQACFNDLESIVEIHNHAIVAKFQTGYTKVFRTEERVLWYHQTNNSAYPMFVYELDGKVVGWLTVSSYRKGRGALRKAVEISYFVHNDHHRKGIASALLEHALDFCMNEYYTNALAIVLDRNTASINMLVQFGFERWGYLPEIAEFDGEECGQIYFGKRLYRYIAPILYTAD